MRYYAHFGLDRFVLGLGYRAGTIRAWFAPPGPGAAEPWTIDLVDTGLDTENGGRIKRLDPYLGNSTFLFTWCDGLADIDLAALLAFHRSHGRLATLTAVHPPSRFGLLDLDGRRVTAFREKAAMNEVWVNGAYFVFEPGVFDYIEGDATSFEHHTLTRLAADGELMAYCHPT